MIIPTYLSVENYCQITSLKVDFTDADIIALTAPNAFGKSNSVFALRLALTGLASPGANRLTDDIRDGQKSAVVRLDFEIVGAGKGHIRREIGRNNTSTTLILEFEGKEQEKIVKSGAAEKRFQELLGVSPKYISEVIISDQYSIASLLFWPASERGPKFQRFLHGVIFAEIEALVQKQKKKLSLDANATQRLESLNQLLKENKDRAEKANNFIRKAKDYLSKGTTIAALSKAIKIKDHTELSNAHNALLKQQTELKREATQLNEQLKASNSVDVKIRVNLKTEIVKCRDEWDKFRPYRENQREIARLKELNTALKDKLKNNNDKLEQETSKTTELSDLTRAKEAFELTTTINESSQLLKFSNEKISSSEEVLSKLNIVNKDLIKLLELEPTYHLIHEGWKHANTHRSDECVLCGGTFSSEKLEELEKEKNRLEVLILDNKEKYKTNTLQINRTEKEIALLKQALQQTQTDLERTEGKLKSLGKITKVWENTTSEGQLDNLTKFIASLSGVREQVEELESELKLNILKLEKLDSEPQIKAPKITEAELKIKELELEKIEQDLEAIQSTKDAILLNSGKSVSYTKLIAESINNFEVQGLPKPDAIFKLTETESEIISKAKEIQEALAQENTGLAGYQGSITTLSGQITHAEKEILGFYDTQAYLSDLEQLESWFKYNGIPSQILKLQLNSLCQKMGTIIENFQLQQQFKLVVDEKLEVYMQYPSGSIRTIQKASGGERMILGLAFRLATHQYLAPELPILIIDEPSNHLHESNQVILQELIRSLKTNLSTYGLRKFIYCTHSNALAGEAEKIINLAESI